VGLIALALTTVVYGLHSAVDWIWFVPGPTVMALVAAGLVAGRGPATVTAPRRAPAVVPVAAPVPALVGAGGPPPPSPPAASNGSSDDAVTAVIPPPPPPPPAPPPAPPARRRLPRFARPVLALLVVLASLLCAWTIWQPLRSDQETDHALDLAASGKTQQALAATERAQDYNPLTPRAAVVKSSIQDAAGRPDQARKTLEDAVKTFPGDPQVWIQLAQYELNTLNKPADALAIIRGALYLDPQSRAAQTVFFQANALLHPAPLPLPTP
jgi:tetratricopeptide (TPR) repeat protein